MALRINLYGCYLPQFLEVLGSKNWSVIETAEHLLADSWGDDATRHKARAWLHTLISDGCVLRREREPPRVPDDGSLLVMRQETELHAVVVCCIFRALFRQKFLDLESESSYWHYSAVGALSDELLRCRFTQSKECPRQLLGWLSALKGGTPLFGDAFCSNWSFYTIFANDELEVFASALGAAQRFERQLPDYVPEEVRKINLTKLSDSGRKFANDLETWFSQIQKAGQDAFIVWW